jgi:hypothetical protein
METLLVQDRFDLMEKGGDRNPLFWRWPAGWKKDLPLARPKGTTITFFMDVDMKDTRPRLAGRILDMRPIVS